MPLTSYCKKCAQDVPVGDVCPQCGRKLPSTAVRLAWCVERTPVKDWMSWNSVLRLILPMMGAVVVLAVTLAGLTAGAAGVAELINGGLLTTLAALLLLLCAVVLLVLILRGDELLDCVMDARGIHVQTYLPEPTALKLLLRRKPTALLQDAVEEQPLLLVSQRDLPWKEIRRIQLWQEKLLILCYSPAWWMRLSLPCTPFTWADALTLLEKKLARKKGVQLPPELTMQAAASAWKPAEQQGGGEPPLPEQPDAALEADLPPEEWTAPDDAPETPREDEAGVS